MRKPIIIDCEQGTPEWFDAKIGVPSVSVYDKIVTTKGEPSKEREGLLFKLAAEKIMRKKEEEYQNAHMLRGIALEPEARRVFSMITEIEVNQVGFVYYDEKRDRGCSPDGLIGSDSGLEIKCPTAATHIGYLLGGKLPARYFQQVQGCLYITNRKYWYFMSYHPDMKPFIMRTTRDDAFIEKLHSEIDRFCSDLNNIVEKIRSGDDLMMR